MVCKDVRNMFDEGGIRSLTIAPCRIAFLTVIEETRV